MRVAPSGQSARSPDQRCDQTLIVGKVIGTTGHDPSAACMYVCTYRAMHVVYHRKEESRGLLHTAPAPLLTIRAASRAVSRFA